MDSLRTPPRVARYDHCYLEIAGEVGSDPPPPPGGRGYGNSPGGAGLNKILSVFISEKNRNLLF